MRQLVSKFIKSITNNLKTNTMADVKLFKPKRLNNHKDIAAAFSDLDTFIDECEHIPAHAKKGVKAMVKGYEDKTGEKVNQISNLAYFNTAVYLINSELEKIEE